MAHIRHVSTTVVRPTSHDDRLTHRIELTPWDLRLMKLNYMQKGLLFQKPTDEEQRKSLVQHLKATFSQTLNIFFALAGRLTAIENEDQSICTSFSLNCNGAGAQFIHAAADHVKLADILDSVYVPDDILQNFCSLNEDWSCEGVSKPLLAAQITELADGIFVGCSMNHMVADGTSFWDFFNTWSEISRVGSDKFVQSPPNFRRDELHHSKVDLPIQLPISYDEIIRSKQPQFGHGSSLDSLKRVVFHFPKEKVAELKSKANVEMDTNCNMIISSLQALMAHLWRAVTRARHLHPHQEVTYRVAVGLRQRLKPPLAKEFFGNALLGITVKSTAGDILQQGLGWTASQINKAIASLTTEEMSKYLENWIQSPTVLPNVKDATGVELVTGNSPRFNVYGNDFGWGRPLAVRSGIAEKMMGSLTVYAGVEEGSIDFEACLLSETLLAMSEDAEFMEALLT